MPIYNVDITLNANVRDHIELYMKGVNASYGSRLQVVSFANVSTSAKPQLKLLCRADHACGSLCMLYSSLCIHSGVRMYTYYTIRTFVIIAMVCNKSMELIQVEANWAHSKACTKAS